MTTAQLEKGVSLMKSLWTLRVLSEWQLWRAGHQRPWFFDRAGREEWDCIDYLFRAFVAENAGYDPAEKQP